jgi:hypothetical protein
MILAVVAFTTRPNPPVSSQGLTATQPVQQTAPVSTNGTPTSTTGQSSTATRVSSSSPTPAAQLAPDGAITENIVFTCTGCNDPIRVTINTVKIENANGRMVWGITLKNITGSNVNYTILEFDLQANASQTKVRATFSQGFGNLASNIETEIQGIFAFVPYSNLTYTLTVVVDSNLGVIRLDPVKLTF